MKKDIQKNERLIEYFEIYKSLLTEKQRDYFELYYFEDYSLAEIADRKQVSRNAIYSSLSQLTVVLNRYESCLKLLIRNEMRRKIYETIHDDELKHALLTIDEL